MMAWILHENGRLCFETTEKPVQGEGEVLIRVKAVGVCGSDIPRIYRGGAYFYPLIPGHEFAGIVAETGADVDEGLRGKHIGRSLYEHVLEFARREGCYNLTLNVWECNLQPLVWMDRAGLLE